MECEEEEEEDGQTDGPTLPRSFRKPLILSHFLSLSLPRHFSSLVSSLSSPREENANANLPFRLSLSLFYENSQRERETHGFRGIRRGFRHYPTVPNPFVSHRAFRQVDVANLVFHFISFYHLYITKNCYH